MTTEITLVQYPIIKHQLQESGKTVSKRIEELEIDKQSATVETVKTLKDLRAELNKELADFENQRKVIKEGINNPYNEFETVYKTEISEKYKSAIDLLKDKIALVEDKIKSEKKASVEVYFKELCDSEKIDFITFDKLGIEINLSTTENKYKEQVNYFIMKVVDDLNLIKSTDFEAEILTEYKSSLNASKAITDVKARKNKEAAETARLKAEQTQNRKNYLQKLGMNFVEITNAYEFNADIYLTMSDINHLSKEQFTAKYAECEAKIKDIKAKEVQKKPLNGTDVNYPTTSPISVPITAPASTAVAASISAPVVESVKEVEPLKKASFEVTATMTQLRALGAYMKENGIIYKNI